MKDKETSIILEFNKNSVNLSKINLKDFEIFGSCNTFKKDEKVEAIIIQNKDKPYLFFITNKGVNGSNMSEKYSKSFRDTLKKIAELVLKKSNLDTKDYTIKATYIEFKSDYSLRESVFSEGFKKKIEEVLTKKGYNIPDYAGINLVLSKDGNIAGNLNMNYKNQAEYKKNNLTIQAPEELKDELSKLK